MIYLAILISILSCGLIVGIFGWKRHNSLEKSKKFELTNGEHGTAILSDANIDDMVPNGFRMGCNTVKVVDTKKVPVEISDPVIKVFSAVFELQELDAWKNRESFVTVTPIEMRESVNRFRQLVNEILEIGEFAELLKERNGIDSLIDEVQDEKETVLYVRELMEEEIEIKEFWKKKYEIVIDPNTDEVVSPKNYQEDVTNHTFFKNYKDEQDFEESMWRLDSIRATLLHYDIHFFAEDIDDLDAKYKGSCADLDDLSKERQVFTDQIKERIPTDFEKISNQIIDYANAVNDLQQRWLDDAKKVADEIENQKQLEAQKAAEIEEQLKIDKRKNFKYTDVSADLKALETETALAKFATEYNKK